MDRPKNNPRTRPLSELGDVFDALERLPVPIFAIDREMIIRWLNRASRDLVGDRQGDLFTEVLEPGSVPVANKAFAQKIVGSVPSTEYEVTLRARDGSLVRAEISSVVVRGGEHIAGVFGLADVDEQASPRRRADGEVSLTPRQAQVLHLACPWLFDGTDGRRTRRRARHGSEPRARRPPSPRCPLAPRSGHRGTRAPARLSQLTEQIAEPLTD